MQTKDKVDQRRSRLLVLVRKDAVIWDRVVQSSPSQNLYVETNHLQVNTSGLYIAEFEKSIRKSEVVAGNRIFCGN